MKSAAWPDEALELIDHLEAQLSEVQDLSDRADRIIRDLAHRATTGEAAAQTVETELGAFLEEVATVTR